MTATPAIDAAAVLAGERRAVAGALNRVEGRFDVGELDGLWPTVMAPSQRGLTVGLTGPPGVGKSTLAGRLITAWRAAGHRVGVLCVDPSSRRSGGALLGDRVRMQLGHPDDGVFIRSLAARGRLGGLAPAAREAAIVMQAAFDRVLVETVGVGQSETDIATLADLTAVVIQPASGDALQFLKAGLMEVFDLLVVNKADLGAVAARAASDLRAALRVLGRGDGAPRPAPVISVSAADGRGLDALVAALEAEGAARLSERPARRHDALVADRVAHHTTEAGLRAVRARGGPHALATAARAIPFGALPSAIDATLLAWFGVP